MLPNYSFDVESKSINIHQLKKESIKITDK